MPQKDPSVKISAVALIAIFALAGLSLVMEKPRPEFISTKPAATGKK